MADAKVHGVDALERQFRKMRAAVEKANADVTKENAEDLAARMRRAAPKVTGNLEKSIRVVPGPDGVSQRVVAGGPLTTKSIGHRTYDREVSLGSGDTQGRVKQEGGAHVTYDYARGVEFGTEDTPALPFFFSTYRKRKRAMKTKQARAIKKAITEALS